MNKIKLLVRNLLFLTKVDLSDKIIPTISNKKLLSALDKKVR